MLDPNLLAQLTQLKTDIQASKDYAEGTVAATSGRYGFVRTDDGRDVFLSPEKMDRLLPGDRVKICVNENAKGKLEAELEKLISSEIKKFVGQYRVKGAGHFVVPAGTQFSRWIFIPPAQRKGTKDGEYVVAKLARHPYKDGKAQANIVFRIGQPDDAYIEHKYIKAKYDLNYRTGDNHTKQIKHIQTTFENANFGEREDLRKHTFVTIDSANTLDMDDALCIEKIDNGYKLIVAIADPSSFIEAESAHGTQARDLGQSVYLLGGTIPMLSAPLSHYAFSLEEAKDKPALIITLEINADGDITQKQFSRGIIQSSAKLSYDQVANYLNNDHSEGMSETIQHLLSHLFSLSQTRRLYREKHFLVLDEHTDYDHQLDEKGHISDIRQRVHNSAQQVVEEAMIATNIAAGAFLKEHNAGIFSVNKGFREERIGEVKALLKEENIATDDINTYEGHLHLIKTLAADNEKVKLIPALRRMMQASELSTTAGPHMSMGVPNYATITSPIRRYADLYNHWCISAILSNSGAPKLNENDLKALNETIGNGRQADRELYQWLICQYVQTLIGTEASGKVRIVTQQGFGVKLIDNGIEGFVLLGKGVEKAFDAKRMSLKTEDNTYYIGDEVRIKITAVDMDKRRIAFEIV